jgi:antitoxin CcdA
MANLSIAPEIINEARAVGIKISSFCEDKLREETQRRRDQQWNEQNAAFLDAYAKLIEKEGVALEEFRTF